MEIEAIGLLSVWMCNRLSLNSRHTLLAVAVLNYCYPASRVWSLDRDVISGTLEINFYQKANCLIISKAINFATLGTSWDFHMTILRAVWWRDSLRASEDVEDRGCAGWTTSWRGLACRGSACCWSSATHLLSQPSLRDDGVVTWHVTLTSLLCVPRVRTCFGSRGFSVADPTIWNSLPLDIRNSCSIASFRRQLKTFLFSTSGHL